MDQSFLTTATRHARCRSQQRGIPVAAVDLVLVHSDWVLHAGDGCQSLRLSRAAALELCHAGINRQLLDRARRLVLVRREDNLAVVTVLHDHGDHRYRRQGQTRKTSGGKRI